MGTSSTTAAPFPWQKAARQRPTRRRGSTSLRPYRSHRALPHAVTGGVSEQVFIKEPGCQSLLQLEMGGSDTVVLAARSPSTTTSASSGRNSSSEESRHRSREEVGALSAGIDTLLGRGGGGGGSRVSSPAGQESAAGELHIIGASHPNVPSSDISLFCMTISRNAP